MYDKHFPMYCIVIFIKLKFHSNFSDFKFKTNFILTARTTNFQTKSLANFFNEPPQKKECRPTVDRRLTSLSDRN